MNKNLRLFKETSELNRVYVYVHVTNNGIVHSPYFSFYQLTKPGFFVLNEPFTKSERHHVSKNVVVYVPKKLHRQYAHNVFSGVGMFDVNATTFNWLSGRYIKDWEMKELKYVLKCNERGTRSNEETKKRIFELFAGLNRREG